MDCPLLLNQYVSQARESLILSRIQRQHATIEEEFDRLHTEFPDEPMFAPGFFKEAAQERSYVKRLLEDAQIIIKNLAEDYPEQSVPSLKITLDGKGFRSWPEYRRCYAEDKQFGGVDPE